LVYGSFVVIMPLTFVLLVEVLDGNKALIFVMVMISLLLAFDDDEDVFVVFVVVEQDDENDGSKLITNLDENFCFSTFF
jgi:hypothetical protein